MISTWYCRPWTKRSTSLRPSPSTASTPIELRPTHLRNSRFQFTTSVRGHTMSTFSTVPCVTEEK